MRAFDTVLVVGSVLAVVVFGARCTVDAHGRSEKLFVVLFTGLFPAVMFITAAIVKFAPVVVLPGWFALSGLVVSGGRPLWLVFDADRFLVDRHPDAPDFSSLRRLIWFLVLIAGWAGGVVLGGWALQ